MCTADSRYEFGTAHVFVPSSGSSTKSSQAYFAKFCFSLGINLKRIEVIADDEAEIVEAAQRMSKNYDFVVTSGGIGPT
jgi:molybdopterin-biosynthesis enzyme MoeA-like protein